MSKLRSNRAAAYSTGHLNQNATRVVVRPTAKGTARSLVKRALINGTVLEYEVRGSGEPLLFIDSILADGLQPLGAEAGLADRYQIITYHKRGWVGSGRGREAVTIAQHAADAAALLEHLAIERAHVAGHCSGAAVALQLAVDRPERVHSLVLLEPMLLTVPAARAFFARAGAALDAHAQGWHEEAWSIFLSAAAGLEWERCRTLLEQHAPGILARAIRDADTCFDVELPAVMRWAFNATQAAPISQPTLSVLGRNTEQLWVDVDTLLRESIPGIETCTVDGVGHLLHLQRPEPVARSMADFLARHRMASTQHMRN